LYYILFAIVGPLMQYTTEYHIPNRTVKVFLELHKLKYFKHPLPKLYDCWCNTVNYASSLKVTMYGIPKRDKWPICKTASEAISPRSKMIFQNSGKLGQYECNNIQFTAL